MGDDQNRNELEKRTCIVGVRFSPVGKIYKFDASKTPDLRMNDIVVVETSRGWQLGRILQVEWDDDKTKRGKRKPIVRRATPRDLLIRQSWHSKEEEVIIYCRQKANELGIEHLKIIQAEYSFDGKHLNIIVSANCEEKIELKKLTPGSTKNLCPCQNRDSSDWP